MMSHLSKSAIAAVALVVLSACSILPDPAPAKVVYRLNVDDTVVPARDNAPVVRVDRPGSSTVFNTRNILVSPDGRRMRQASGAQWVQAIPLMVQDSIVDSLGQVPDLVGVLPSSGARTDTRIHLVIKNFEAQFDQGETAAPIAVVNYTVTLADASDRRLIDTFATSHKVRADTINVSEIVEAMEEANSRAMGDIVNWLQVSAQQGQI